jgi:hypothetical protein
MFVTEHSYTIKDVCKLFQIKKQQQGNPKNREMQVPIKSFKMKLVMQR